MNSVRVRPFPGVESLPSISGTTINGTKEKSYDFRTITPVFGAGVEARKLDSHTPVRGTTVRGHLRFWWRATCGRQYKTVHELKKAETAVWGSASQPSAVQIAVAAIEGQAEEGAQRTKFPDHYPKYALFPFQDEPDNKVLYADDWKTLKFTVLVRVPREELIAEVETALWAWANFGGIGGRTRRGCGALFCKDFAPDALEVADPDWVSFRLRDIQTAAPPCLWPRLTGAALAGHKPVGPLHAWESAIGMLAEFRQARTAGARYGRSRWPEADSLRAQSKRGNTNHLTSITLPNPASLPAFPRAELGLPYQVKFKHDDPLDKLNDCDVLPEGSKRMASPLIIRPLAIGPMGDKAVPMVLCLEAPLPLRVRVMRQNHEVRFAVPPTLRSPALATYPNSPMASSTTAGSALEAFLLFATTRLAGL